MENDKENDLDKKTQHIAALSIGIICLVVGLPLWWKTTEVYRVSLPYSAIHQLSESQIKYLTEVDVIWAADLNTDKFHLSALAKKLKNLLDGIKNLQSTLVPKYRVTVRQADSLELMIIDKAQTASDLKPNFPSEQLNKYNVVVIKTKDTLSLPVLGPKNNVFLPYNDADADGVSAQIAQLVRDIVKDSAVAKSLEVARGLKTQRPDKDTMRSYRYHSGYDITFTLMVPEPQIMNIEWDIEAGIADYLQPLLDSLAVYTDLTVSSQVLYLVSLGGRPKAGDGFFYYTEEDLPHVINPLESKLGSHASNNPGLNFIVCIPLRSQSPLYILDSKGKRLASNAFLSPRWGGVKIYNIEEQDSNNSDSQIGPTSVDMHSVMEVFVTQIKLLLNVQAQMVTSEMKVLNTGTSQLHQWEIAAWLRCRCVENLATATSTLLSLAQLVEEIGNLVIHDEIGKEVESAVDSIKQSHKLLASGELETAFLMSRAAVNASELAFFHPSLLELLYFPEDQKFAIYIPLFLPVSFPIILSMISAIKWFSAQRRKQKVA